MTPRELKLRYKFETGHDIEEIRKRFFFVDPKYRSILDYLDWMEELTLKTIKENNELRSRH
jgi:hypothetical protein